jgi:hypothetical protein
MFTATIEDNDQVSWNEFYTALCGCHNLAGVMRRKLQEFMDLCQGTDSVYEYIKKFHNLVLIMSIPMTRR